MMTYDDYLQLPDDGNRYEVIDGELVLNPSPTFRHQIILGNILIAFRLYFREHGGGVAVLAPLDVVLSPHQVYQPDVLVILDNRRSIITDRNVSGAPNLVIEVLSPGTRRRDLKQKRANYERYGVAEYWIVDPDEETVAIDRRNGEGFTRIGVFASEPGNRLTTPLVPGFSMLVAEVFAE